MSTPFILLLSLCCFLVFTQAIIFEAEVAEALSLPLNHGGNLPHHPPNIAPGPQYFHHPRHPHHHSPSPSPAYPPTHLPGIPPAKQAPVKAPVKAPVHPPFHPLTRSFVAVQGVVYCKSCRYPGVDTFLGALPILGATVKLKCNSTKYPVEVIGKTDKNGYFFVEAPKTITSYGFHKCKVFLVSSPQTKCSKPSNLHNGLVGAALRPWKSYFSNKLPFVLFNVGPFAFEPSCPRG